jgi:aspartyl-tRNA synthetase
MLLTYNENIREVIAFPFNQKAQDLMMNAPVDIEDRQLKELSIKKL